MKDDSALLIVGTSESGRVEEYALQYARSFSCDLDVLQILNSHLYHYGRSDVIVPGYARTQFLCHVQDELQRHGDRYATELRRRAERLGVRVNVRTEETDDAAEAVCREAAKGYAFIFIPEEKRGIFPLFNRGTVEDALRKRGFRNIVVR